MFGIDSGIDNDAEDDEDYNGHNLQGGKPIFYRWDTGMSDQGW